MRGVDGVSECNMVGWKVETNLMSVFFFFRDTVEMRHHFYEGRLKFQAMVLEDEELRLEIDNGSEEEEEEDEANKRDLQPIRL